jgi:hypothetical protein
MKTYAKCAAALLLSALATLASLTSPSQASDQPDIMEAEWRGVVVCLPEAMHELYGVELPSTHEHVYGFKTDEGAFYTLVRTRLSEAIFMDAKLRQRTLALKGRVFPRSHIFEVTRIRSIRDGAVCEVFYYCNVCSIESIAPHQCVCCQEPVELVEKLAQ